MQNPQSYTKINQFIQNSDLIGAFSGYIRKPQPSLSGMVAQVFGPNGEESDSILALSLTKYLDAEVFVTIYQIKDCNGVLKKMPNGQYPKIAEFLGVIRRALPTRGGMTAQFFTSNGKDADSVTELGKSIYFDSLVFVEVRGKFAYQNSNDYLSPTKTIDEEFANKVSQYEIKEYKKQEKTFKKYNDQLALSGFYKKTDVLLALTNENDYINYLSNNGCCWPGAKDCLTHKTTPYKIKQINGPFNYLVFCDEHLSMINNDLKNLSGGFTYLEMKQGLKLQEFAIFEFQNKFALQSGYEADSYKILEWAKLNKLDKYLPSSWKKLND